jgi:hypothetical protein
VPVVGKPATLTATVQAPSGAAFIWIARFDTVAETAGDAESVTLTSNL